MKKGNAIDRFLHKLIEEHLDKVSLFLMAVMAIAVRMCLMSETSLSPDYESYYLPWVNEYRNFGFFAGLGKSIGDYYVPYNIMYAICALLPVEPYIPITFFSGLAEAVSALYISKIVRLLLKEQGENDAKAAKIAAFAGMITLFLPFVVFNGALWKQCDAIYVVFLIIAVYHLLSGEERFSFVFLSVSFAFKLQAIFFVPLFLIVYMIRKSFGILEFVWIPVMYFVMGLPSVVAGKGLRATYLAYFAQTQETTTEGYGMVSYYPNIYNFGLDNFDELLKLPAVILTAALMILIAVYVYHNKKFFDNAKNLLLSGIFMAWTCCMFLPGMHERYDYAVVLLFTAICLAVDRKLVPAAIVMNINSLLVYIIVLFAQYDISMIWISALQILAYFCVACEIARRVEKQVE